MLHMSTHAGANEPSASSSYPNSNRQGEKRKRDGGQPPLPPTPNPGESETMTTRERVVEILSNTANGCLSELGYYPGMPGRLKELEIQTVKWRDENVKLYQDNQQLTSMLQALNTNDTTQKILDLQNEVKRLQVENESQRNFLENPQLEYTKILQKHNQLYNSYKMIYQENLQLKMQLNSLTHNRQILNVPPQVHQSAQPPFPSNTQQPHAIQTGHNAGQQSPSAHSPSQSLQMPLDQGHRNQLTQTQYAVLQNRQHSLSNPSSRRSSLHTIGPTVQSPQVPPQPYNPQVNLNPEAQMLAMQRQYHALDSTRQMVSSGNDHMYITRRASAPSVPNQHGNPYPFSQTTRIASNHVVSRPGSATPMILNQSPRNSSTVLPNPYHILAERPTFGRPPTGSPSDFFRNNVKQIVQPPANTISPQDTYINPPAQPPVVPVSPQPLIIQDTSLQRGGHITTTPVVPSPNASTSFLSAPFAHSHTLLDPPPSRSSPKPERPPDKTHEEPQKPEQQSLENTASDTFGSAGVSRKLSSPVAMQVDAPQEEEEESEEEDIELGPDGLRTVKDCLFTLFGDPIDGRVTCRLCQRRFEDGFQKEPPISFVNASDKELEDHCLEEHEHPWQMLRNPDSE